MDAFLKMLQTALAIGMAIGAELFGVFGAPLLATRITNVIKAFKRTIWKEPWHALVWHSITWWITFGASLYSFQLKYDFWQAIIFVAFIVAWFNTAIVEWMYKKAAKHESANAAMNKILLMPEEEIDVKTKLGAFVSGMTVKTDQRETVRK